MTNQLPAYLQTGAVDDWGDDAVHGLGGARPPSLSIKGQKFTLIDASGNELNASQWDPQAQKLFTDVILVDANPHVSHTYYAEKFDPSAEDFMPPTCFSDNGEAPSSQAQQPQSPSCATCPHNQWGSEISQLTGAKTKACRDAKKLAVIPVGVPGLPPGMVFLLRIPPASLNKQFAPYVRSLKGQNTGSRPVQPSDVVTRLTFDPQTQGVLNFTAVNWITQEQFQAVTAARTSGDTAQLVGKLDAPIRPALAAPMAQVQPALQAQPTQQFGGQPGTSQTPPNQPVAPIGSVGSTFGQPQPAQAPQQAAFGQAPQPQPAQFGGQPAATQPPQGMFGQAGGQAPQVQPAQTAEGKPRTRRGRQSAANAGTQQGQAAVQTAPQAQAQPTQQFGGQPVVSDGVQIPTFLQRDPSVQQPQAQQQSGGQPHGIVQAPGPDQQLAATLAAALGNPGGQ